MPEVIPREILNPSIYYKKPPPFSEYTGTILKKEPEWEDTESFVEHIHLVAKKPKTRKINLTDAFSIELPTFFHELANQIETSRTILELSDNWDDEGSLGYKEETFFQAVDFLTKYAVWIWDEKRTLIETPEILPAQNGSIDLFWKKEQYDLLINIPPYPNSIAKFYGDDKIETKIEGEFPLKSYNQGIFLCLLNSE